MLKNTREDSRHGHSHGHSHGDARRDQGRGKNSGHRYELIEMAVLFGTAAVADLLVDALGHGVEGPGVLGCLSAMLIAVVIVHRAWIRHTTSPPRGRRTGAAVTEMADSAADAAATSAATGPSEGNEPEPAEVGALWRLRTSVEDTPGRLAVLAGALAAAGANILTLQVHPTGSGATDEFLVRTPPGTSADKLTAAVRAVGGGEPWVGRAEVQALADPTAHALALARQLLPRPNLSPTVDPKSKQWDQGQGTEEGAGAGGGDADVETEPGERLLAVLAELLDANEVEWCTSEGMSAAESTGADCDTLRLDLPGHATVQITRTGLPFTPAECARARAMADLAAASGSFKPGNPNRAPGDYEPTCDRA